MKIEKKIIGIILALTIGLSTFVGLTLAAPPAKQSPAVMLGSYYGHFVSPSVGSGVVAGAEVTTDKPAIFTVTVSLSGYKDAADTVWLAIAPNKWFWSTAAGMPLSGDDDDMTFTVAGFGVDLTYYDSTAKNLEVVFCIIVQGEAGTVVKNGEW